MIQSGQLDERIAIYRPTVASIDGRGGDVAGTPTIVRTIWAQVVPLQGRELEAASQRWAEAKYRITVRRQPGIEIRRTDYISWNGQTLDILDVHGQGTREDTWRIVAQDHVN